MTAEIKGLDKLLRKLKSVAELRGARRGMKAGALHIKGKIATYPPASIANSPAQKRWYERGYGPKWHRADGTIGGSKTSETLGRKWTISQENAGLTQIVGNNVSYGPFVHGPEEQASFHAARGWKTTDEVIKEEGPRVLDFVKSEIDKELAGE